jgi:tetratricopeptide (TPR) repeat protein
LAASGTPHDLAGLAEALHNIGDLSTQLGGLGQGETESYDRKAAAAYAEALEIRRRLAANDVHNVAYRRDLARTNGYLGDLLLDQGRYAEARAVYEASHRLRDELSKIPGADLEPRFQLARSHGNLARWARADGKIESAVEAASRALQIQQELVRSGPSPGSAEDVGTAAGLGRDFSEYQEDLAATYELLGELAGKQERPEPGAEFLRKAILLYESLLRDYTRNARYLRGLARCHVELALLTSSTAELDRASSFYSRLGAEGKLDDPQLRAEEAWSLAVRGEIAHREGREDVARRLLTDAIATQRKLCTQFRNGSEHQRHLAATERFLASLPRL